MRIVIIGAVAAGTAAAAKASRNDPKAEIVIYEKDRDISYSACGLPYYIGNEIADIHEIVPRTGIDFKQMYNVDVLTEHEVLSVDGLAKTLQVRNLQNGDVFEDTYDKLIIATGAVAKPPQVEGSSLPHVFSLRTVQNARAMKSFLETRKPRTAVIAGTGFIGLEMLENLTRLGLSVTLLEKRDAIARHLEPEMSEHLLSLLHEKNVQILLNARIHAIHEDHVVLEDGRTMPAQMVLLATGVKPDTRLAEMMGLTLGASGSIRVDERMETSMKDVYACGDCAQTFSAITGQPNYRPLGSTAAKTGRIAGDAATGGPMRYRGNLGASIFRVFDWTVATVGLSTKEAIASGFDPVPCLHDQPDRPEYLGGLEMRIWAIADRKSGRLLGAQIIGPQGVDKRIDVLASLITFGAKADDLPHIDLTYAPPFSTTRDPVHYTGMLLESAIRRGKK